MICPRCQQENPPRSNFCLGCGIRFGAACAACGADLPAGSRFCNRCGAPAAETAGAAVPADSPRFGSPRGYTPSHLAERILTSRSALEGERKQVTVMFAELKGSRELLADRDPEEARKLLDPVLDLMMEVVHRYEGTVNQIMGDGIMALFGAPIAHEDQLGDLTGTADELGYIPGVGPHARLGEVIAFLGEFSEAVAFARRALRLAESGERPGDLIVALGVLGFIHLVKGDHREAIPLLERGLALCRDWGILDWSTTIMSGLGLAYARDGRFVEAIALHHRAGEEEAREAQGTPAAGLLRLAGTYVVAGRFEDARGSAERALDLARAAGERSLEARALRLLGEAEGGGASADADRARQHLEAALAWSEVLGLRPDAARGHLGLGALCARTGRCAEAGQHLATALAMFRAMEMPYWIEAAARAMEEASR